MLWIELSLVVRRVQLNFASFSVLSVTPSCRRLLCVLAGGFCQGAQVQQREGLGRESCRLGPHVPEHLADCENHLHAG